MHSLLTHLGENVTERAEAEAATTAYLSLLDQIQQASLPAEISVKLTQLGLDVDAELCFANLSRLFSHPLHAQPGARVVWIDMEHSPYVDVTLAVYRRAREAGANVGVALQAYLYRTEQDLRSLLPLGGAVRLVKGAYREPSEIAYPLKHDVDESYFRLAHIMSEEARRYNVRSVMATHDLALIGRIQAVGRGGSDSEGTGRVRDALRNPARGAVAPGERGLPQLRACFVRQILVSVVHAALSRAACQRPFSFA